ncbi:hypothetical protein PIIN_09851, partial [Serendipita indica DSM 11827]
DINSVAFSPNGCRIVSCSEDRTIRLWDAEIGEQIGQPLRGHTSYVKSVSFSPDGYFIVSSSSDGTVRLWNSTSESLDLLPNLHSVIDGDGWLLTPDGKPLFWVPPQFRTGLVRHGVRIMGQCQRLEVDLSRSVYGEEWTRVTEARND